MIYGAIIRKRIGLLVPVRRYHRKVAIKIYWHAFPKVANGGRCKIATLDPSLFAILLRDWPLYLSVYFITRICRGRGKRKRGNFLFKAKLKLRIEILFYVPINIEGRNFVAVLNSIRLKWYSFI